MGGGGERPWEGKGGKGLNRERVGKILRRKGGGGRSQQGKGGKDLSEKGRRSQAGKRP